MKLKAIRERNNIKWRKNEKDKDIKSVHQLTQYDGKVPRILSIPKCVETQWGIKSF